MADKIKIKKHLTHAIVQTDDGEAGHAISYHTSLESAENYWHDKIRGTTDADSHMIVEIQSGMTCSLEEKPAQYRDYESWNYEKLVEINPN